LTHGWAYVNLRDSNQLPVRPLNGIYLDYNAFSPIRPGAMAAMARALEPGFGNPSSVHRYGHRSKLLMESARDSVASLLGASSDEIVFTSGGTEANNLALLGAAGKAGAGHVITSSMEHSSVLEPLRTLEGRGFRVTRVPPDREGVVDPAAILREVRSDTILVSLIHSSNEVGTLQPVQELGGYLRARRIPLHTDAVQSAGRVPMSSSAMGVDLLSLSSHKIGGPSGVGCLWVRRGVTLAPMLLGGGQESNRRAGTEPVPLVAGFGAAAELAREELPGESERIRTLRDRLETDLEGRIPDIRIHGRHHRRLPNTSSVMLEGCPGEETMMALDLEGIAVSTGSACAVGTVRPSHVLMAMGCSDAEARSTLRISLGHGTTEEHLDRLVEALGKIARRMRGASGEGAASSKSSRGGAP
jgi:cysteine desulfurase